MKMPRSRSILITFLLSVSFVIPACTPKPPIATETTTPTATPKATETPTPAPTETPDSSFNIESPQWSYEVFNSGIGDTASSQVVGGPIFDQQNRQVEWFVQYSLILPENASPAVIKAYQSLLNIRLSDDFKAEFEDKNGVILGTETLWKEGQGNRKRYTLRIPDSIWQRWSEVARINLAR